MALEKQLLQYYPWDKETLSPSKSYAQFNSQRFKNANQGPVYVDGIRFMVSSPMNIFSIIDTKVQFGRNTPMTHDYIPIWLLGSEFNRQITPNVPKAMDGGEVPVYTWQRNWMFPQPMLMAHDDELVIEVKLEGNVPLEHGKYLVDYLPSAAQDITIYCMLLTRTCGMDFQIPNTINVPWVSWWRTPDFRFGKINEGDDFVSKFGDLQNPFDQEVRIERMTGRLFVGGFDVYDIGDAYQDVLINPQIDAAYDAISLRMNRPDNRGIIRQFTPFGSLFQISDQSWWCKSIMAPRSYYIARVRADLRDYPDGWVGTPYNSATSWMDLALQGYREVRIR